MEIRNWAYLLFSILLLLLIFKFLRSIFKSDAKHQFTNDRIYVDYNTYKKPKSPVTSRHSAPSFSSPGLSQKIDTAWREVHTGRLELASKLFQKGMAQSLANAPEDLQEESPQANAQFEKYRRLGSQPLEGLSEAKLLFFQKRYKDAAQVLTSLAESLDPDDLQHRIQIYDVLSECFFQSKDKDGYVNSKVKYVQTLRKIREMVNKTFPNQATANTPDWMSAEEATQNILRISGSFPEGPEKEMVIRRATYDSEVARRLWN